MLVLARKLGEKLVVPSCGLTITVLRVQGKKVRLGITADSGVEVHREEVWQRKCAQDDEEEACLIPLSASS
jgi:carbon storage regulator